MQKPRQSYTLEFKRNIVALDITHCSVLKAACELSISAENIRRWNNQLDDERLDNRGKQTTESKLLQLKRLRRELAEVKMERTF